MTLLSPDKMDICEQDKICNTWIHWFFSFKITWRLDSMVLVAPFQLGIFCEPMRLQTCFSFLDTGSLHKSTLHTVSWCWAGSTKMAQIRQKGQKLARHNPQLTPTSRRSAAASLSLGPTALPVGLLLLRGLGRHSIIPIAGAALDLTLLTCSRCTGVTPMWGELQLQVKNFTWIYFSDGKINECWQSHRLGKVPYPYSRNSCKTSHAATPAVSPYSTKGQINLWAMLRHPCD